MFCEGYPLDRVAVSYCGNGFGAYGVADESRDLDGGILDCTKRGHREKSITCAYSVHNFGAKGRDLEKAFALLITQRPLVTSSDYHLFATKARSHLPDDVSKLSEATSSFESDLMLGDADKISPAVLGYGIEPQIAGVDLGIHC